MVVNPALVMSGTLTPASPSCTVALGAGTCNINFSWTTTNPVATSAVTKPINITVGSGNSGTNVPFVIKWGGDTFYLYNNAVLLAQSTVASSSVTCAPGTGWNGSVCATSVNGTPGSANGKTYPNGTTGYGSDTQCATGTSSNTAFPSAGSSVNWMCLGSNGGTDGGPYSASQAAPAVPVTIIAGKITIVEGDSTTLTWNGSGPCTGTNFSTGAGNPPSGGVSVSPTSTTTYTVNCSNGSALVIVTVRKKPTFIEN